MGLGQSFGKDWIRGVSDESKILQPSWQDYSKYKYSEMVLRTPEYVQDMNKAHSGAEQNCYADPSPSNNQDPSDFIRHVEALKNVCS